MAIYEQTPIRLELTFAGSPPNPPVDSNTGEKPRFWRGSSVGLRAGIFDAMGNPVDLSNLTSLQAILQPDQDSPYNLWTLTLLQSDNDINNLISVAGWENGTQWNAEFDLSKAQTDQGLGGVGSADYWLTIIGTTGAGNPIVYGAGPVTIYSPGNTGGVPTPPPEGLFGLTKVNAPNTGDFALTPVGQIDKHVVTVAGAARTVNCILGTNGMVDNASETILFKLPSTAGITINVRSGVVGNPVIATISTESVLQARALFYYDSTGGGWLAEEFNLPYP